MIRSLPAIDRLDRDGRTLLLFERQVVEVGALALECHEFASEGTTLEALGAHLGEVFGAPPEGDLAENVRTLVTQLTAQGVLEETT